MATLKELMGDLKRGDGRCFFDLTLRLIFEPIYLADGLWYGLSNNGNHYIFEENGFPTWEIDKPAKPKKKVKVYSALVKRSDGCYFMMGDHYSDKTIFDGIKNEIIGWHEIEVEVDK